MVGHFKYLFSIFKQYYTNFHIFFHAHVFQKITNNTTQTPLPKEPNFLRIECEYYNIRLEAIDAIGVCGFQLAQLVKSLMVV